MYVSDVAWADSLISHGKWRLWKQWDQIPGETRVKYRCLYLRLTWSWLLSTGHQSSGRGDPCPKCLNPSDLWQISNHKFLPKGNPNREYLTTMCLVSNRAVSWPDRFVTNKHEFLPKGNPNRVYLTTMCLVSKRADTPLSPSPRLTPRSIHYQPPRSRQHNPSCQEW